MAANTRIRLGRPSDIKAVDDVIQKHKMLKMEVIQALKDLSEKAEGLVIEQVEDNMWSTAGKMVGRGIVIGCGIASIILAPAAGLGAAIGIGGIVVGYLVYGGSKLYEMKCSRKHAEKLKDISDKVEAEVNRYTESQKKMFSELGTLSAFDAGQGFAENLRLIRDIVERAETEANRFFSNIDEVVAALKKCFNSLSEDKKRNLDAEDFLLTMSSLTKEASMPSKVKLGDFGSAAASVIGDAAGAAPWWEVFQGLNVLINAGLICMDIKKFWKLYKMREAWNEGGEAKQDLLKNPIFKEELSMKNLIDNIRIQIADAVC